MANIGKADLLIVPKFDGLQKRVKRALDGVEKDYESSGKRSGQGFGKGLGSSGAAIGAFSAITSKAIDSIASHVGDATARFDTMNNYPKVMESLGYSTRDAEASIGKMGDRLSSLPTRLDDMATTVQGLAVITGDLDKATDAGLALNDMLLASGSSTQLTTAAMEQFRQMLSKGKPEMEDWKSLTSAMPGQMDQLAKSMLGPTANANDLYKALGGGGEATISMEQLLDQIIKLDKQGGDGFQSFQKQAETATGGVRTSMSNMSNAITKGIAGTMDAIGKENIAGTFNGIKDVINSAFKAVNGVISKTMPLIKGVVENLKPMAPAIATAVGAFAGFKVLGGVASHFRDTIRAMDEFSRSGADIPKSLSPANLAFTAAAAGVSLLVSAYVDVKRKQENFETSTKGLAETVADTATLSGYTETIDNIGGAAKPAAMNVDKLAESTAKHVEAMEHNNSTAEAQIAKLNTAQKVIDECAGKTELSAEQQGKLEWAVKALNDELGINITKTDVMAGEYRDADGNVVNLKDSVYKLIEAKKEEARVAALTANLTEAYQSQSDAAATLAQAQANYNQQVDYWSQKFPDMSREQIEAEKVGRKWHDELDRAQGIYDNATSAVGNLETQLGTQAQAMNADASELERFCSATSPLFQATLAQNGTNVAQLSQSLGDLGVDTSSLKSLSEDQLNQLAQCYDGTKGSIVGKLGELNVAMGNTDAVTAAKAESMAAHMRGMDGSFAQSMADMGYDLNALAGKLSDAGVSTQTLNGIGSGNLLALARNCNGDMDQMVSAIQRYNDKDLEHKNSEVNVAHGSLDDANAGIKKFNNQPKNLGTKEGHVNIFQNIIEKVFHASGGIRTHADGGITAPQPRGAGIATQAVPLDIVGEDGAEAIVPLTNRRYSQPFADIIAERVVKRAAAERPDEERLTADDIAAAIVRGLSRTGFRLEMDADGMALRLAPAIDRQLGYRTEMGYA